MARDHPSLEWVLCAWRKIWTWSYTGPHGVNFNVRFPKKIIKPYSSIEMIWLWKWKEDDFEEASKNRRLLYQQSSSKYSTTSQASRTPVRPTFRRRELLSNPELLKNLPKVINYHARWLLNHTFSQNWKIIVADALPVSNLFEPNGAAKSKKFFNWLMEAIWPHVKTCYKKVSDRVWTSSRITRKICWK